MYIMAFYRDCLRELDLNQANLAKLLKISRYTLNQRLRHGVRIDLDEVVRLEAVFKRQGKKQVFNRLYRHEMLRRVERLKLDK